jgi:hypothetical protein
LLLVKSERGLDISAERQKLIIQEVYGGADQVARDNSDSGAIELLKVFDWSPKSSSHRMLFAEYD